MVRQSVFPPAHERAARRDRGAGRKGTLSLPITRIIRWNLVFIAALALYGLATDEPYWRETGHGPELYDYLFWFGLVFNGPAGFAADYLSWLALSDIEARFVLQYIVWGVLLWAQWRLYHALALWSAASHQKTLMVYGSALLIALAGAAAAYEAWLFGHRPSDGFIDRYFWFVRVAGLGCAGLVLFGYVNLSARARTRSRTTSRTP